MLPLFAVLALVMARTVWSKQVSLYDRGGPLAFLVGPSGRYGYDAATAFGVAPSFAVLAVAASFGHGAFFEALVMVGIVGVIFGFAECLVMLLFLIPRLFAPPHLRDKRGWIPQAVHDLGTVAGVPLAPRRQAVGPRVSTVTGRQRR